MSTILEMFIHLSKDEQEILMAEYKDEMAMKFALSRMINKEIAKHCEQIAMSDKWLLRNSIIEPDDSESEAI